MDALHSVRLRVASGDSLGLATRFDASRGFELEVIPASDPTRTTTLWLTIEEVTLLRDRLTFVLGGAR